MRILLRMVNGDTHTVTVEHNFFTELLRVHTANIPQGKYRIVGQDTGWMVFDREDGKPLVLRIEHITSITPDEH